MAWQRLPSSRSSPVKADCKQLTEAWIYALKYVLWSSNLLNWVLIRSGILFTCQEPSSRLLLTLNHLLLIHHFYFLGWLLGKGRSSSKALNQNIRAKQALSIWESKAGLYFMEYRCWSKTLWSLTSTARELPWTKQTADALTNYY